MNRKQKPYVLQKRNNIKLILKIIQGKGIRITFLFLFCYCRVFAQINISNPSFEGLPSQIGAVPPPWSVCFGTPDIQPGQFCINNLPNDGSNYIGCYCLDNTSIGFEIFEQQLSVPLQFGKWYTFDIYLAKGDNTRMGCAVTLNSNVGFEIWAGYSSCSKTKLLAKTDTIDHLNWKKYTLKFQSDGAYTHIILQSRFLGSNPAAYGYLLMDNMSPYLYEVNPQVWFTSSQSTALPDSCSVLYSMQTDSLINNVILLESKLLDSTIQATKLSDSTAQASFNYAKQCGVIKDTLIVRALFNFGYFAYDTLIIDINCPDSSCTPPALPTITFTNPSPNSTQPCSYSTTGYTDSVYTKVVMHSTLLNTKDSILSTSGNDTTWSFPLSYPASCISNLQDTLIATGYFNNGYTTTDTLILNISCLKPQDSCSIDTTTPPPDTSQAELIIPNLITPNGDGKNDFFEIIHTQNQKILLRIYNRWGDLVYQTHNYQNTWGANVRDGLYYYQLEAGDKSFKGWIHLIR